MRLRCHLRLCRWQFLPKKECCHEGISIDGDFTVWQKRQFGRLRQGKLHFCYILSKRQCRDCNRMQQLTVATMGYCGETYWENISYPLPVARINQ